MQLIHDNLQQQFSLMTCSSISRIGRKNITSQLYQTYLFENQSRFWFNKFINEDCVTRSLCFIHTEAHQPITPAIMLNQIYLVTFILLKGESSFTVESYILLLMSVNICQMSPFIPQLNGVHESLYISICRPA